MPDRTDHNSAKEFHRRLVEWINDFDADLDEAHEVGVRLVTFGQSITIRLHDLSYWNPSLMKFIGTREDTGDPVELIQHVTQISILLTALKRLDTSTPKPRMGFAAPESGPADEP